MDKKINMENYKNLSLVNLPGEKWIPVTITGYEKNYMISNKGRVKSLFRNQYNNCKLSVVNKPRILCQFDAGKGYLYVGLVVNRKKKIMRVHRLVGMAFNKNPKNKPEINHIDGIRNNNVSTNLQWSTYIENQKHSYEALNRKGTYLGRRGANHPSSIPILRLNEKGEILAKYGSAKIASEKLNISDTAIKVACYKNRPTKSGLILIQGEKEYVPVYK